MSSIAASGAYWISTASDAILSMPSTLTGSIGVFGMFPDISEFLYRYPGITTDGHGTTKFTGFYRPDISLTEDMKTILTLGIENIYNKFLDFVSASRDIQMSEINKVAGGRVWSGNAAVSNNLVDNLGTLEDAIALAVQKSGVVNYSVDFHEPRENLRHVILRGLTGAVASATGRNNIGAKLSDFIVSTFPFFSERRSGSDIVFKNIFNEKQVLYLGPKYIFR
jgi:protease-4